MRDGGSSRRWWQTLHLLQEEHNSEGPQAGAIRPSPQGRLDAEYSVGKWRRWEWNLSARSAEVMFDWITHKTLVPTSQCRNSFYTIKKNMLISCRQKKSMFVLNPYTCGKTQLLAAKHVKNIVTIGLHMVNKRCKTRTVSFVIYTTRSKARKLNKNIPNYSRLPCWISSPGPPYVFFNF